MEQGKGDGQEDRGMDGKTESMRAWHFGALSTPNSLLMWNRHIKPLPTNSNIGAETQANHQTAWGRRNLLIVKLLVETGSFQKSRRRGTGEQQAFISRAPQQAALLLLHRHWNLAAGWKACWRQAVLKTLNNKQLKSSQLLLSFSTLPGMTF